jgi:hypothetical protein
VVDHSTLLSEVHAILSRTSMDELRAFAVIARRVMGAGRKVYGPTIIANDARDYKQEAAEECFDATWYFALDHVRRRDRLERFNEDFEEQPTTERPILVCPDCSHVGIHSAGCPWVTVVPPPLAFDVSDGGVE